MSKFLTDMLLRGVLCAAVMAAPLFVCPAQDGAGEVNPHNVYVELFEASNIVSVSYDTRFPDSKVFGWRAGVGFSACPYDWPIEYWTGLSFPVGVNALFGNRASKFEIGIGVTPGIYARKAELEYVYWPDRDYYCSWGERAVMRWYGACSFSLDLGYRLQRQSGFGMRVGLAPCMSVTSECLAPHLWSFIPYVGFGYTFR